MSDTDAVIPIAPFLGAPSHKNYVEFRRFLREYGINEERARNFYETVLAHLIATFVRRGDTVIDCGANAGRHTFNFLRALGGVGACIAIEPNPAMVEVLRSRLHGHIFAGNVDLKPVAVGASAGSATFNVFDAEPALSRMTTTWQPPGYEGRTITVDVVPLDDMSIQPRTTFIKIDVEGYEVPVLEGATKLIARDRPYIFFECNVPSALGAHGWRLFEIFEQFDYVIYSAAGQVVNRAMADKPLPTNHFACPKESAPEVAEKLHFAILKALLHALAGRRIGDA